MTGLMILVATALGFSLGILIGRAECAERRKIPRPN